MTDSLQPDFALSCPIPISDYPHITLAHGGGGKLMHHLIDTLFRAAFASTTIDPDETNLLVTDHDGAVFRINGKVAFTTDSYVVNPLFFPGGDIGTLAVHGTVNDLAMCGATPKYLSVGMILEEGLPMLDLWRVVCSMRDAALLCGIKIVTGDTKVVQRGKGDGIFINTTGIGILEHAKQVAPSEVRPGDAILLSGDIGRHGMAIMTQREGLTLETPIISDCAALHTPVQSLLQAGIDVHCLRDCTRGGLASALIEIAQTAQCHIHIEEAHIPISPEVRGACELLGLDPLAIANEGRFIAFVPAHQVSWALAILGAHSVCRDVVVIGQVTQDTPRQVTLTSQIGVRRILEMYSGEQLPRIC